jgi:hypothetical protein
VAERTEYEERMLVLFMDRYNELTVEHHVQAMCWDELPLGVRESVAGALSTVVDQVERDMY